MISASNTEAIHALLWINTSAVMKKEEGTQRKVSPWCMHCTVAAVDDKKAPVGWAEFEATLNGE